MFVEGINLSAQRIAGLSVISCEMAMGAALTSEGVLWIQ